MVVAIDLGSFMAFELSSKIPPFILEEIGDISLNFPNQSCREDVCALLERTVLCKGKRLRPILTYLIGNLMGLRPEEVKLCADSIELVHAASLAHDDVIDQAVTRRGMPSINTEGNKRAVLSGDFLLAGVMSDLAVRGDSRLVKEMGTVVASLSWGEWLQLEASEGRRYNRDILREIALHKTASVMIWCAVAPACVASLPGPLVEYCRCLGSEFGLAFQWMDDIMDFSRNSSKELHLDIKNGMVNTVLYEYLEARPGLKRRFEKGESLNDLVDVSEPPEEAIEIVRKRAEEKLQRCRHLLSILLEEIPGGDRVGERERRLEALEPIEAIFCYLSGQE